MGDVRGSSGVSWDRAGIPMLLLFWLLLVVPPSLLQPPLPLSLPVRMSAVPPSWQFLPLSQAELGPLFSNSSPFSFSQSFFMVPPPGQDSRPGLQASFGPYSVTRLISEPVLPRSHSLTASLLSEHVDKELDEGGQERFQVRVLFHQRGDSSTQRTCVTMHAFKETEEHKASCMTQPPLGLCVASLTLPSDWFKDQHTNQSRHDLDKWPRDVRSHRRVQTRQRGGRHHNSFISRRRAPPRYTTGADGQEEVPHALRYQRGPVRNQIQLYYSSFNTQLTQPECVEDKASQSQRQLFHVKAVTLRDEQVEDGRWKYQKEQTGTTEEEDCLNGMEEEELRLDSHVLIRYHRGPVLIGQPTRLSVNVRANFSTEFVVIRLKVKKGLVSMVAQRTLTSDLWAVTLDRSQGSRHDVVSIVCLKHNTLKHTHNPAVLHQVVCLSVEGLRRSFGVAMSVSTNWWVEYSGQNNPSSPQAAAVTVFSFTDRPVVGIAPITESNMIINTAVLTNQPVSLPVIVLAVSRDGKVSDVTSAVTCRSTNEDIVKVSSDCSAFFVDGSESGLGNTCAVVEFLLGTLSGSVCVEVWAPSVPLRVLVTDPVLNAIEGWDHLTEKGCVPVYQRSSVQVLTQFTAQDSHSRTTHLLGSSDWFVDVTELVQNWLRVEDPQVAYLGAQSTLIGLQPGKTSLHVFSEQWDGTLGSCDIIVTSDTVAPGDLSVQVVSGLGMSVTGSPAHPSIITATVTAYNILYNPDQEASISVWLQFSDDTASLLSAFSDLPSFLHLSSLAETVVVVTASLSHRIFARGDGGGPLLRAELMISSCTDQLITSNSISGGKGDSDVTDGRGGGGTRMLARGSGWIRVNLDLGFLQQVGNEDELEFDIADMLVESDGGVYSSKPEEDADKTEMEDLSSDNDYYYRLSGRMTNKNWKEGRNGMASRNNLERAVLMPSNEEGTVHFSPSQTKEGKRVEEDKQGAQELEVGLGAVLALVCLCAVLFLANCLPCALRDRRRKMIQELTEEKTEGGKKQEAEDDGYQRKTEIREETEEKDVVELEENHKDDVKEVETIC